MMIRLDGSRAGDDGRQLWNLGFQVWERSQDDWLVIIPGDRLLPVLHTRWQLHQGPVPEWPAWTPVGDVAIAAGRYGEVIASKGPGLLQMMTDSEEYTYVCTKAEWNEDAHLWTFTEGLIRTWL